MGKAKFSSDLERRVRVMHTIEQAVLGIVLTGAYGWMRLTSIFNGSSLSSKEMAEYLATGKAGLRTLHRYTESNLHARERVSKVIQI
jgi:hypothetical protein